MIQRFFRNAIHEFRTNLRLSIGIIMFTSLILFTLIGPMIVNVQDSRPLSGMPVQPPSGEYPFGTDDQGRNLFARGGCWYSDDPARWINRGNCWHRDWNLPRFYQRLRWRDI